MKKSMIAAAVLLAAGCATQDDINRAVTDDLRHTGNVMGYAIDADLEVLTLRAALLRVFAGDPKLPALEEALGTTADVEAKLERVRASKRALLEENKKLRARYLPEGEE